MLYPWNHNEEPFWINPENGIEWYIDKFATNLCNAEKPNKLPPLNAVAFHLAEVKNNEREYITSIVIEKDTNEVLAEENGVEKLGVKIDLLRFNKSFEGE